MSPDDFVPADRTAPASDALVVAAQADLADGVEHVRRAVAVFAALRKSARGLNGLADDCASWVASLEGVAVGAAKASGALPAKLGERKSVEPITQHVDRDLAERVARARKDDTPAERSA